MGFHQLQMCPDKSALGKGKWDEGLFKSLSLSTSFLHAAGYARVPDRTIGTALPQPCGTQCNQTTGVRARNTASRPAALRRCKPEISQGSLEGSELSRFQRHSKEKFIDLAILSGLKDVKIQRARERSSPAARKA